MSVVTWNPDDKGDLVSLSEENLVAFVPNLRNGVRATKGVENGKWYWEISFRAPSREMLVGVSSQDLGVSLPSQFSSPYFRGYYVSGEKYPENVAYGTPWGLGDIIGVAVDMDNGTLSFYKNGITQGFSHTNLKVLGAVYPHVTSGSSTISNINVANFGATPFSIIAQNPDAWQQLRANGFLPYDLNNATWMTKQKSLLKSNNKLYTLDKVTNTLGDITSSIIDINNITKLEYETHGFDNLSGVTASHLSELERPINLLYYRDGITNTTESPRLRQEYDLNVGVRQMIKKPMV